MYVLAAIWEVEKNWRITVKNISLLIYKLISIIYNIFIELASFEVFDNDTAQVIYNRVGVVLGIAMIFYLTFNMIVLLLDPDKMLDKEKGMFASIKKAVLVVLLLWGVPLIFSGALKVQKVIVENNTIAKILLPSTIDTKNFGNKFAWDLFFCFFTDQEDPRVNVTVFSGNGDPGLTILQEQMVAGASTSVFNDYIEEEGRDSNGYEVFTVEFDWLFCIIVGAFVCWTLVVYCVNIAIRAFQFAFLRLIAPVPIMAYLSPGKDNAFSRWVKQCITTYLDLFIKIATLNFAVVLCQIIMGSEGYGSNMSQLLSNSGHSGWVKIILILGVIAFLKRAPKLIEEMVGKSNAASIKFGEGSEHVTGFVRAGALLAASAYGSAAGNVGRFKGAVADFKNGDVGGGLKKLGGVAGNVAGTMLVGAGRAGTSMVTAKQGQLGKSMAETRKRQLQAVRMNNQQIAVGMKWHQRMLADLAHNTGAPDFLEMLYRKSNAASKIMKVIKESDGVSAAKSNYETQYKRLTEKYGQSFANLTESDQHSFRCIDKDGIDLGYTLGDLKTAIKQASDVAYRQEFDKIASDIEVFNNAAGTNFSATSSYIGDSIEDILKAAEAEYSEFHDPYIGHYGGKNMK